MNNLPCSSQWLCISRSSGSTPSFSKTSPFSSISHPPSLFSYPTSTKNKTLPRRIPKTAAPNGSSTPISASPRHPRGCSTARACDRYVPRPRSCSADPCCAAIPTSPSDRAAAKARAWRACADNRRRDRCAVLPRIDTATAAATRSAEPTRMSNAPRKKKIPASERARSFRCCTSRSSSRAPADIPRYRPVSPRGAAQFAPVRVDRGNRRPSSHC